MVKHDVVDDGGHFHESMVMVDDDDNGSYNGRC